MKMIQNRVVGFTLIELLVVMVILGVAVSLVGSFSIDWVDKAKILDEKQAVIRWIRQQSSDAFIKNDSRSFLFDGKAIYRIPNESDMEQAKITENIIYRCEYLFFHSQFITFNSNGYTSNDDLTFNIANNVQSLNLTNILSIKDESQAN
jgi:prepilin-type N-terminal cleavage/methylation domain-containing protein